MSCRRPLILSLVLLLPTAAFAQKRPITFDDLWKVKRLGKPTLSPDGKWAAVEVTSYDIDDNSSSSQIWMLSTDGKTQRQLTNSTGKNSGPLYSPDGKWIAFTAKRTADGTQIFVISPEGGEARQVTKMPMTPFGLKWAADSKSLYCLANIWPDTPNDASYKKKEKEQKDSKTQAYVIDDALYRIWDTWIADGKRPVVFRVDLATGKHYNLFIHTRRTLPPATSDAASYDVSPDGKELCFTSETTKEIGTDFNLDLYTMPIGNRIEPRNITTDNEGNDFNPLYSPRADEPGLAFLRQTTKFFYADRQRVMTLGIYATKEPHEIRHPRDRTCTALNWIETGARTPQLAMEVETNGFHELHFVHLAGGPWNLTKGYSDTGLAVAAKIEPSGVFLRTSFDRPGELWHLPDFDHDPAVTRIDRFNDDITSQWNLGPVKNVTYKGADGDDVQMWIVCPPGFDAKKKYPLVMFVHGGPHNGIATDFHYRWNFHLLASKGYVVACPNFHGSSGFGQKFTDSITGDMATKPFIDVMKATDYMEATGYIDKNRMAAVGASYGGYMMAWINGHTDRFKAMVCHAGVYNWHSMTASDFVRSRERPLGALPWGDMAKIDKQTPQRFAANFKTPTLVTHGEKDYRVPITQGMEYYNTLRIKGVPTRFVYFPDENHWILKPANAKLWTHEMFAWLDKYLGK